MNNLNPLYCLEENDIFLNESFASMAYNTGKSMQNVGAGVSGGGMVSFLSAFPTAILAKGHPEIAATMMGGGFGSMGLGYALHNLGTKVQRFALYKDLAKKYGAQKATRMIERHYGTAAKKEAIRALNGSTDSAVTSAAAAVSAAV